MLLKGAYCVGEHFVDPQCSPKSRLRINRVFCFLNVQGFFSYCLLKVPFTLHLAISSVDNLNK